MTSYNAGDIVLLPFPFTDQSASKQRPAVVVSSDSYHRNKDDVIVLAVTGQLRPIHEIGEFEIQHWEEAGLLKPSVTKAVVTTVARSLIRRRLGKLSSVDMQQLQQMLTTMLMTGEY